VDEPEAAALSGEIVKRPAEAAVTPPAVGMRYTDDSAVARVFVRVEYADGRIREYQAQEPQDFKMNDPESMSSMVMSRSRGALPAGGGFVPLTRAVSSVRLSFTAHPRWNLHIRTERTAPEDFEGISYR
jgi:hypothetical protein